MAALELEATITATESPHSLSKELPVLSDFPIPDAGVGIDGIVTLGAFLSYSIDVDATFSGSADLDFGVNASLPDSARIVADYHNHSASSASGFDSSDLTPIFNLNNASASVTLSATSKPELKFGFDFDKFGKVDVDVTINLPEASVKLSTISGRSLFLSVRRSAMVD